MLQTVETSSRKLSNDGWTFLPQLRCACTQLLAGPITMNKNNKIYGRRGNAIVHRENFINKKGNSASLSLPPVTTKYPYIWATIMKDIGGGKLVAGTKALNALIVSCLQIGSIHEASVGGDHLAF
ncbi:hypothetical protein BY458DRAFT_489903 [Sporodiniella umbellata]|nr:hypothetical protein BY458DRAFT_489903 [Sporodiniella umbellata]